MSVRVVARIRPLQRPELEKDAIVEAIGADPATSKPSIVKIPNPKNFSEDFTFQFNSVYGQDSTQQELFDTEGKLAGDSLNCKALTQGSVTPTVKHLFLGCDVTIFAYGSTGTGKTHTMRGGKSLADRGMIPRLLSSIYRRSRRLEKESGGEKNVEISMSYYEIYNDRVYDLFEAPEKRTAVGLPLREAAGGKTVVVGLSEMPCGSLKEFEVLYDRANSNRSTSATKLNAHSSRSHAILCVKLTITTPYEARVSTASAIDLAGSEDNRRTGNDKERMVESASINKSLFVLAQCVEAISKKQHRIPYRESKMTRILSLGQNNGFTVMILNLAPVRSYHLDTLSSLNFANRTKKIEVREIENEPIFKGPPRSLPVATGSSIQRQPLRPLAAGVNVNLGAHKADTKSGDKPLKAFSVYSDRTKPRISHAPPRSSPLKRGPEPLSSTRPTKTTARPTPPSFLRRGPAAEPNLSKATIEQLVEQKVSAILAAERSQKGQDQPFHQGPSQTSPNPSSQPSPPRQQASVGASEEVQRRLASIEQRLEGQEGARAEGLSFLLMAKQHQARGEENSALKMYQLAEPYFPGNEKLERKIDVLSARIEAKRREKTLPAKKSGVPDQDDGSDGDGSYYHEFDDRANGNNAEPDDAGDASFSSEDDFRPRAKKPRKPQQRKRRLRVSSPDPLDTHPGHASPPLTPRTSHLLSIINTRDVGQIKALKGVGPKRAEGIVDCLGEMHDVDVVSLKQLSGLRGVGFKVVQGMRGGIEIAESGF
jgi:Kinesin motor domain